MQAALPGKKRSPKADAVRYRRAPFLISYWRENNLVFENFLTQSRVSASPLTSTILHFFDRDRPLRALCARLTDYTPGVSTESSADACAAFAIKATGEQAPAR